jgi:glycosyltransferase involved in cell wall biosynthesis
MILVCFVRFAHMNIALLSAFYPYRGGISQFGAHTYRELAKDHHVSAFTFKRQYPSILFPGKTQFVSEDDNADAIPSIRSLDSINPLTFGATARKIKETNPDVLITQYWMPFLAPAVGSVAGRMSANTKKVGLLHNALPHESGRLDKSLLRSYLRKHDAFVVLSESVEEDLKRLYPGDYPICRLFHPLYDHFGEGILRHVALQKFDIPSTKKTLLFFGLIRDYKGLDILLEALNQLDESYHLIVAGECYGDRSKYDSLIKEHKLSDRITFHERYIPDSEVATYFSAADLCVLPYRSATQSGITMISLHFNTPVLATQVGGLGETIVNGETGILVESADPTLVSSGIERYFESMNPTDVQVAISTMKSPLSWGEFGSKLSDFCKSL